MASRPDGELGLRILKVQTSNRRLRDDEFMIPAKLTEGNDQIRLKIRFIDNVQQLAPGIPFPNQSAWSELGYQVYSIVIPSFKVE